MADFWGYFVQAMLLSLALTLDNLFASFSYGAEKIKIPFSQKLLIVTISTTVLCISLFIGGAVGQYVPEAVGKWLGFSILLLIGIIKLLQSLFKNLGRRKPERQIEFSLFSLKFILNICNDATSADADKSKDLSIKELIAFSLALSTDSLTVGLTTGMQYDSLALKLLFTAFAFLFGIAMFYIGYFAGGKVANKVKSDLSWLGGVFFIGLAVAKLFI